MAISALARSGLRIALRQVQDLGRDATFINNQSSYDYSDSQLETDSTASTTIRILPIRTILRDGRVLTNILANAEDMQGLDRFDKVNFDGYDWSLVAIQFDDVITELMVSRPA